MTTLLPPDAADARLVVSAAIAELDWLLPDWLAAVEGELPVLYALADIREALADLKRLESVLHTEACQRMVGDRVAAPDLFAEKRRTAKGERWDRDAMYGKVINHVAVDHATGEFIPRAGEVVHRFLAFCAPISKWRVNALKAAGIDYSDERHVDEWVPSVTVSRAAPKEADE